MSKGSVKRVCASTAMESGQTRQAVSSAKVRGAARGIDAETRTSSAAPIAARSSLDTSSIAGR